MYILKEEKILWKRELDIHYMENCTMDYHSGNHYILEPCYRHYSYVYLNCIEPTNKIIEMLESDDIEIRRMGVNLCLQ